MRLQRKGRKQRPFYHIVIADSRAPRDGKFIERLGSYNPMTKPATIELDRDKAYDWLVKGAQPTDTVRAILRFKGVYYKKHLMRGVKKGAMTLEEAEAKYQEWVTAKDAKVAARFARSAEERANVLAAIAGTPPVEPVVEEVEEEVEEAVAETTEEAPAAEETAETVEATAEEEETEAPAEEAAAEAEAPAEESEEATEEKE